MASFVDPYFLRQLKRQYDSNPQHCLIVWKEDLDFKALKLDLAKDFELVNSFLYGRIVHCKGNRSKMQNLLTHEAIEVLHATYPPAIY